MGIKLHCPNGHKLNVKSFLAGRRGICPDCGAKFEIPADAEDDGAPETPAVAPSGPAGAGSPVGYSGPPAGMSPGPAVMPAPVSTMAQMPLQAAPAFAPVVPTLGAPGMMAPPGVMPLPLMPSAPGMSPMMAPPPPALSGDVLAELPQARWYVRPPSGGQFGPAQGDMMRRWIGEGRITVDSWVWREGWPEWQPASRALAAYFAAPSSPVMLGAGPVSDLGSVLAGPTSARQAYPTRRKSDSGLAIAMIVILALVALVLSGVFVAIIFTNS